MLREAKNLTQNDIEKRTGLLRAYLSRIENNHATPGVAILERWTRALEVPLYQLFYESDKPPTTGIPRGREGKDARYWQKLVRLLGRMDEADRQLLLHAAEKMARR